jgi:hypothetical protein
MADQLNRLLVPGCLHLPESMIHFESSGLHDSTV